MAMLDYRKVISQDISMVSFFVLLSAGFSEGGNFAAESL